MNKINNSQEHLSTNDHIHFYNVPLPSTSRDSNSMHNSINSRPEIQMGNGNQTSSQEFVGTNVIIPISYDSQIGPPRSEASPSIPAVNNVDPLDSSLTYFNQTLRTNLNRVFPFSVGPLVQQNRTINNVRNWMHRSSSRYMQVHRNENNVTDPRRMQVNRSVSLPTDSNSNIVDNGNSTINIEPNNAFETEEENSRNSSSNQSNPVESSSSNQASVIISQEQQIEIPNNEANRRNRPNSNGNDEDNAAADVLVKFMCCLLRYLPYVGILLLKSSYDHLRGFTDLIFLQACMLLVNTSIKEQVAKQSQKKILILCRELFVIIFYMVPRYFFSDFEHPEIGLFLYHSYDSTVSLKEVFFAVLLTDLMLKLITAAIKIIITMMPGNIIPYKRRGRLFVLIESFSQFYRCLAPIQLWLLFLFSSYEGFEIIVGVSLVTLYMINKIFDIVDRVKFLKKSFVHCLQNVNYGRQPTNEELQEANEHCAICHDSYDSPVILECNHMFCETCISTWFLREQTCPLCRTKVVENQTWQDGRTTYFIQLF